MKSRPATRKPSGFFLHLCFATLLVALQGCVALPDTDREMARRPPRQVQFEDAAGTVSDARGRVILQRLESQGLVTDVLQKHLAYEQAVNANSPLVLGNKLTLLQNGPDTYKAMFAAIAKARDHINLETFIFADDEAGRQFATLLLQRRAAGVQVNLIYDSIGSLATPPEFFARLVDGGINVLQFNPVNPLEGKQKEWLLNHRDHRKLLVIDGRIAFTGGINISSTYSSGPSGWGARRKAGKPIDPTAGWRDTHVQVEGPVVAEFQKLFIATWNKQQGRPLAGNYYPKLDAQGDQIVRAIGSTPDDPESLIYLTLISAITHAEQEVHLTIAYFAPDPQLLKALTDAVQRGVDVKLVLPSQTDSWAIFNLGRSYYTQLLRAGVRIYEQRGAILHAKTACIDGVWSTIGSTNLDWRSFLHNDEINAVVVGRSFAAQMETMFAQDLKQSQAVTLDQWSDRSLGKRVKEQTARIGAYWL